MERIASRCQSRGRPPGVAGGRRWLRILSLLAFGAGGTFAPLAAEVPAPYVATFQTIRPLLLPVQEELESGQFAVRLGVNWANVWSAQLSRFTIDGEELSLEPHIRYALSAQDQIGLSVPLKVIGGGAMDNSIESFHRAFGFPNQGREDYRRNRLNVSYEPLGPAYALIDGDWVRTKLREFDFRAYPRRQHSPPVPGGGPLGIDLFGATESRPLSGGSLSGAGDPIFSYQHDFAQLRPGLRFSGGLLVKFAGAGAAPLSSGGTDVGVFAALSGPLPGSFAYELGLTHAWLADRRFLVLELPSTQWVARAGLLRPIGLGWTALVEYVTFTRPVVDFGRLSERGHLVALAFRRDAAGGRLVLAAVENLITYGTTPDIAMHASYEIRW